MAPGGGAGCWGRAPGEDTVAERFAKLETERDQLRRELHDSESILASLTDHVNTFCREESVAEATDTHSSLVDTIGAVYYRMRSKEQKLRRELSDLEHWVGAQM